MALPSFSSARFQFQLSIVIYLLTIPVQFYFSARENAIPLKSVSEDHPILNFTKSPYDEFTRQTIRVAGASLLNLPRCANVRRVTVTVRGAAGKRFRGNVEICSRRYLYMSSCQCEKGECRPLQKGEWSEELSPYGNRFIDALFEEDAFGIVTVSLEEELQRRRLVCLLMVFILHFCAPLVSSWALLYYTSSMAMGVILLIIFSLYQGMKLISSGRKGFLYMSLGSLASAGMFTVRFFTGLVDSILVNFGIVADIHNSVQLSVLVLAVLAGAGLGYWVVRTYVVSEDGSVKTGVAKTVRWTMRFIAIVFLSVSTLEPLLGWVAWCTSWFICSLITSRNWRTRAIQHPTNTDVMSEVPNVNLEGSPRENRRASNVTSPASRSRNDRRAANVASPASPSRNGRHVTLSASPSRNDRRTSNVTSPAGPSRNGRRVTSPASPFRNDRRASNVTSPASPSRNGRRVTSLASSFRNDRRASNVISPASSSRNGRHVTLSATLSRNECNAIRRRWSDGMLR